MLSLIRMIQPRLFILGSLLLPMVLSMAIELQPDTPFCLTFSGNDAYTLSYVSTGFKNHDVACTISQNNKVFY